VGSGPVEWLEREVEAWNTGDLDRFLDALGPDVEFTPDPSFPDSATYRGEDVYRWLRDWARMWDQARLEVLGTEERNGILIVGSRWHLVARQTSDEIPIRDFTLVFDFEPSGDRPRGIWAFFDRDRAVEKAAELSG
jgi:hypothetical protein